MSSKRSGRGSKKHSESRCSTSAFALGTRVELAWKSMVSLTAWLCRVEEDMHSVSQEKID